MKRSKQSHDSVNIFTRMQKQDMHTHMSEMLRVPYAVAGGIGVTAVLLSNAIDWSNEAIVLSPDAQLPNIRDNGTRRDADVLICSVDDADIKQGKTTLQDAIGDDVVVSAFGLLPYEKRSHWLSFVGDRYLQGDSIDDPNAALFYRTCSVETEIPMGSILPWPVVMNDEVVCATLSPIAHLGAYKNCSVSGLRPKDRQKFEELRYKIFGENGTYKSIPADYREQLLAMEYHASKVARERRRVGEIGIKAAVLGSLERNQLLVRLAQGTLDPVLAATVNKR